MDTSSTNLQSHENLFGELAKCSETPTSPSSALGDWYITPDSNFHGAPCGLREPCYLGHWGGNNTMMGQSAPSLWSSSHTMPEVTPMNVENLCAPAMKNAIFMNDYFNRENGKLAYNVHQMKRHTLLTYTINTTDILWQKCSALCLFT